MSKIIAIEGPDRCGKATQSKLLCARLISMGYAAKVVEVPIDDNVTHPIIYWMLGNGLAKKFPKLFQRLQVLNRQIFQATLLRDYEKTYDFVIFDRWSLSTTIYGLAAGLKKEYVDSLYTKLRVPDITFVLLGDAHPHTAEDVYEADAVLQWSVRQFYAAWASDNIDECCVLDCNQPRDWIAGEIEAALEAAGLASRSQMI